MRRQDGGHLRLPYVSSYATTPYYQNSDQWRLSTSTTTDSAGITCRLKSVITKCLTEAASLPRIEYVFDIGKGSSRLPQRRVRMERKPPPNRCRC